jgi:hypothetical protein
MNLTIHVLSFVVSSGRKQRTYSWPGHCLIKLFSRFFACVQILNKYKYILRSKIAAICVFFQNNGPFLDFFEGV